MSNSCCYVFIIVISVMLTFSGFVMTMYGFIHKPFWNSSDDWCSFCKESREAEQKRIDNCKIAGPIVLSLGIFGIILGCILYKNDKQAVRNNFTAGVTRGNVTTTTYSSTGQVVGQGGYPPQGGYPMQQGGYPQPQPAGYPPQQPAGYPSQQPAGYPPQQQTYPSYPPQAGYYPNQSYPAYPPPPQNTDLSKISDAPPSYAEVAQQQAYPSAPAMLPEKH